MRTTKHLLAVTAALLVAAAPLEAQGQGQGGGKPRPASQAKPSNREKPQQAGAANRKPEQARAARQNEQRPQQAGRQKPQQQERARGQSGRGEQGGGQQGARGSQANARGNAATRSQARGAGRPGWAAADALPAKRVSRPVRFDGAPAQLRQLARSDQPSGRAAAVALARAHEFGDVPASFRRTGSGYRVVNQRNDILFELSDDEARRLGFWDIRRLDPDRVRSGAPAFCRSGAGHPVWGREWCIDKGFGLGSSDGWLWGRHNPDDVFFERDERTRLDRGGLIDVLGSIIFNRLAVHALTLGLVDPLAGQWLGEPAGPRVMTLHSGTVPVAELVDWDRDGSVDVMYVVSRD